MKTAPFKTTCGVRRNKSPTWVIVIKIVLLGFVTGFMSTGEGDTSGNYAILDQMAAMHWLRENIQSFGGDPNRVTLFGHGYGAALVNILLVSPVTKGNTWLKSKRASVQKKSYHCIGFCFLSKHCHHSYLVKIMSV